MTIEKIKEVVYFLLDVFNKIRDILSGYKAYIVGALAIGIGIYVKDIATILFGLSTITIRAGLAKK
jgi:hypothetical protein